MNLAEKARIRDVPQIHQLINSYAEKGEMLARPLSELYESVRDLFVVREDARVIGCAALHVDWSDLAEVRSVAVVVEARSKGVGASLVKACINEAREIGIPTVFCLTARSGFFEQLGFRQVDRLELPRKVWTECYRCSKFPDCDEVALVYDLR